MTDNIVRFGGDTMLPLPVDQVLESAKTLIPEIVVVVGWDHEGKFFMSSTHSEMEQVLMLLEYGKMDVMDHMRESNDGQG